MQTAFRKELVLAAAFLSGCSGSAWAQLKDAASADFFEAKVRPILAANCYSCHTDSQLGGLRLDSAQAMLKGGGRGPAIVPGDPDKSLLIQAVRHVNADLKMPLNGSKLKDSEIADLAAWIKAGAVWPASAAKGPNTATDSAKYVIPPERRNFWSFVPLSNPPVPEVKDSKWAKSPIDHFVLARLEKEDLKPVASATKHDLLRRATLDLIGIPPTPAEYEAFEKDQSPDAFAKVVDRLLASPHYGERWGRLWLDVARYAEDDIRGITLKGYHDYPNAYLYRDWVIQALNDDMPYDQFIKAQIAGDLLDPKTRQKMLPATGFLGLGPWYFDTAKAETARAQERNEQIDVVTRGILGLTVACARCHNHKYDPIPQTDYYSLGGIFANTTYRDYPQAPKSVIEQRAKLEGEINRKQLEVRQYEDELKNNLAASFVSQVSNYLMGVWEATAKKKDVAEIVEARKLDYEVLERWISFMSKPTTWHHEKDAWQALMKKDASEQEVQKAADNFQARVVRVLEAKQDLDADNKIIEDQSIKGTKRITVADLTKPSDFKTNDQFCVGCFIPYERLPEQDFNFWVEIFQVEIPPEGYDGYIAALGLIHLKPAPLAFSGWGLQSRVSNEEWSRLGALKKDLEKLKAQLAPSYPWIDGIADKDTITDLELNVHGSVFNLGPKVPRHFLSVLSKGDPQPYTEGSGRLQLADDIVKQPIAMRVIVNRIWREHFGTGIVETPSNLGQTGEHPTDPELLEYLASKFVQDGMSIKKLHREIMLSQTYQLSTEINKEDAVKDEANRLYWRANERRMTAEQLRDSVLAVAGSLDDSMGGPSIVLTPTATRRTIYGRISRFKLDQFLQTFDYPNPASSAEKRFTTTVPLQRLFLMNSDFMQMRAEAMAKATEDQPDGRARIRKLYNLAFGRNPSELEVTKGLDYIRSEPMRQYQEQLAKVGSVKQTSQSESSNSVGASDTRSSGESDSEFEEPSMMSGVGAADGSGSELHYKVTVWGRYAKILLGSSEFIYIN